MNILRRGGRRGEPAKDEIAKQESGPRRIEITVEREWVSMLVRQRPGAAAEEPQSLKGESGTTTE
jgi:hypothetical protein